MKYKLFFGLIFIGLQVQAHFPSYSNVQIKISEQSDKIEKLHLNICAYQRDNKFSFGDTSLTAELIRLSKRWMEAMLRHDSTLLKELMAPEYKLQRWDGNVVVYRPDWLNNLFNYIKITHWEQSDFLAQVYGDVAIVTSLYGWAGSFHDKAFDSKGYLTDVWVRHNNHWQVISRTNGAFEGSKTLYPKERTTK